jgi:hypothetical protein
VKSKSRNVGTRYREKSVVELYRRLQMAARALPSIPILMVVARISLIMKPAHYHPVKG